VQTQKLQLIYTKLGDQTKAGLLWNKRLYE